MTHPFEADSTPDDLDVRCVRCGAVAVFTYARAFFVESKTERARLTRNPAFELEVDVGGANNHRTVAIAYAHFGASVAQRGASVRSWGQRFGSRGTVRCPGCAAVFKHELRWPRDAAYACEVRGQTLWAWTRAHAVALRDFIASDDRRRRGPFWLSLLHLPTHFLRARHRAEAVKKLERLLEADHRRSKKGRGRPKN